MQPLEVSIHPMPMRLGGSLPVSCEEGGDEKQYLSRLEHSYRSAASAEPGVEPAHHAPTEPMIFEVLRREGRQPLVGVAFHDWAPRRRYRRSIPAMALA